MRKRNLSYLLDKLIYFLFLTVPIVICLVMAFNNPVSSIGDYLNSMNGIMSGTMIYDPINQAIGVDGLVPMVNTKTAFLIDWMAWAATVMVFHLLLDVILFFPTIFRDGFVKLHITDDNY